MILTAKTQRPRLPLKFASILLALVTALLSSLMFGGMPRTTALGSAFNPATTTVALQPSRVQPHIVAESVRRDDEPASGQGDAIAAVPVLAVPATPSYGLPPPPTPLKSAPALPLPPDLAGSPRGPPVS